MNKTDGGAIFAALLLVLAACGDDGGSNSVSSSTNSVSSSSGSGGAGAGGTSGVGGMGGSGGIPETEIHGCLSTSATDMTGMAVVELQWFNPHSSCIVVGVGTEVIWKGAFTAHPLMGGVSDTTDPASPITLADQTTNQAPVTFTSKGTYPYFCGVHTMQMQGVVYVVDAPQGSGGAGGAGGSM